jgi:hypothetical protein
LTRGESGQYKWHEIARHNDEQWRRWLEEPEEPSAGRAPAKRRGKAR